MVRGDGQVRHRRLPTNPPPPPLQKIITGFLRFVWTPLGSSGGSVLRGVRTPRPPWPATLLNLDKFWASQEVYYNFKCDIYVTFKMSGYNRNQK